MSIDFKWGFVGDLQIPFQDDRAIELFFKVMKTWKPDAIDVVGDIDDQPEYSQWTDGTTAEFFNQLKAKQKANEKREADHAKILAKATGYSETFWMPDPPPMEPIDPLPFIKEHADGAREFYSKLRKQHKNADIHASLGNHDIRVFKYMDKKAPDFVKEVTPNFLWGLDDLGITWRRYDDPPLERFAGIHVHHGDTTTTTGLAVKQDIDNYNISLVRGHDHRGGVVYKTYPMSDLTLVGMGTGHLCDPNSTGMRYTINPGWQLGFGIGHVYENKAHLQFIPITPDYTCFVDGKCFSV